jgi:preprotein translocase subunit SecF
VSLQERLDRLCRAAADSRPAGVESRAGRLADYERRLCRDLAEAFARLREECATEPVTMNDLPPEVRDRFIGRSGKFLLMVYPAEDIWQEHRLGHFVEDLQRVVPDVGGVPVQFHESDKLLRQGYVRAGQLALVFVVFYLVMHFRGLLLPLVATVTLLVGASWGLGALAVLEIHVNPANLLALPLTFGIGVDYAIHLVNRNREARRFRSLAGAPAILATSTGRAVLLSSATTMVGFGALCLSTHRGVASIGWTICVGVLASLLAALLFCPALLRLIAGPSPPLSLDGRPGPKTGPGGETIRPDEPEA